MVEEGELRYSGMWKSPHLEQVRNVQLEELEPAERERKERGRLEGGRERENERVV